MTVAVATLGFPRIGLRRELKFALESYWAGKSTLADLQTAAAGLRAVGWGRQKALGADILPSNDFSLYDHVLDTSALVGAVPPRYDWAGETVDPDLYFAMARGAQAPAGCGHAHDTTAMEMTKWFDTNYHFLVPELAAGQTFRIASTKIFDEYEEAKALGYATRPVLLGLVSYLMLAKGKAVEPLALLRAGEAQRASGLLLPVGRLRQRCSEEQRGRGENGSDTSDHCGSPLRMRTNGSMRRSTLSRSMK